MNRTTILATGLRQGKISNGMSKVRKRILDYSPDEKIQVYSWKQYEEIPEIADKLVSEWINNKTELIFGGHSWGVWFLSLLLKRLDAFTVPVRALCSADGVNRPPKKVLILSRNLEELYSWYQTEGIIKGSKIEAETNWIINEEVFVRHPFVDEVEGFQNTLFHLSTGQRSKL